MTSVFMKEQSITLRPCRIEDESFLLAVYASTRQDELALVDWAQSQKDAFVKMQFDAQRQFYSEYYPGAEYQVIQSEGVDIGRLIVDREPGYILLMDIALLTDYRNQGIGTALIRGLLIEATQACTPVILQVETFNRALRLYERLGFIKSQETGIYYEMRWHPGVI